MNASQRRGVRRINKRLFPIGTEVTWTVKDSNPAPNFKVIGYRGLDIRIERPMNGAFRALRTQARANELQKVSE